MKNQIKLNMKTKYHDFFQEQNSLYDFLKKSVKILQTQKFS